MAYRARFNQRDKLPTLHSSACPHAQFVKPQARQIAGFHESGDALRVLDVITSAKAYQVLDKDYPGKVKVCGCAEGSTLKLVRSRALAGTAR